jgi:hypothetical protein
MKKSLQLASLLLAFSPVVLAQPPGWTESRESNAVESYNFTRFALEGTVASGASMHPKLAVSCIPAANAGSGTRGKFLSASVHFGAPIKVEMIEPMEIHGLNYLPKVGVRYRTDGAKSDEKDFWTPGAEKTSAVIPRDVLKTLLAARSVSITASDDHGTPIAMTFDMPDNAPVRAACNFD